jgi:hypothetical protein
MIQSGGAIADLLCEPNQGMEGNLRTTAEKATKGDCA